MNTINLETTVAQLVINEPGLMRIFDGLGIDYCCNGKIPLSEACKNRGLDPQTVVQTINAFLSTGGGVAAPTDTINWNESGLTELCDHISHTHHDYLIEELPRLAGFVNKVAAVHGGQHPELHEVKEIFANLYKELLSHTEDEEKNLFPLIRKAEDDGPFHAQPGTISKLIQQMESEHDEAGAYLASIRRLTNGYTVPADACGSYRAMLTGLEALESDTHRHIHKENNILFPRAIEKEKALSTDN